ncbi:hypothetical protein HGRIS_009696 [Hohenbuehelia grisea]|uniref:DNA replication factor Cdt1 C-terminal domain-containing protein n=1 Tax=Hohenbuehelia grisea TaxID=104357 RepID=A0ABR3J2B9_9AGAR
MSDIYSGLQVSPRKKRHCPPEADDENTLTPKKSRIAPLTPPPTASRKSAKKDASPLPPHLSRLNTIQTALQHALSHALATCAASPSSDTGILRNVLNQFSLSTYAGLTTQFSVDDLRRLCWVWEWNGKALPTSKSKYDDDEDNPFLDHEPEPQPKDWARGSMGFVVSATTHFSKADGKRVPAYGIGIEVEMDIDKDMGGGMAAVARWTAAAEERRGEFREKLAQWVKLHPASDPVPHIPFAELPQLPTSSKVSALTRLLESASPKGKAASSASLLERPPSPSPSPFASPSKSPFKSPTKLDLLRSPSKKKEFAIPFPITPSSRAEKNSILFPQTPSSSRNRPDPVAALLTPQTPRTPTSSFSEPTSECSTPTHQRGAGAATAPQTPSTSRRQALYERVRQRSLSASPTKTPRHDITGGKLTRDQMLKLGQEELRRRCLLGRLGGVAESVWMFFSTPSGSITSTPSRKRRALRLAEVAAAVVKSSPVPISNAEATESLSMLADLCPFFLKPLNVGGEEWLEMPAPVTPETPVSPTKSPSKPPPSPGSKGKHASEVELVTRSPRRVKRETGGLREVREIIRRELELQD